MPCHLPPRARKNRSSPASHHRGPPSETGSRREPIKGVRNLFSAAPALAASIQAQTAPSSTPPTPNRRTASPAARLAAPAPTQRRTRARSLAPPNPAVAAPPRLATEPGSASRPRCPRATATSLTTSNPPPAEPAPPGRRCVPHTGTPTRSTRRLPQGTTCTAPDRDAPAGGLPVGVPPLRVGQRQPTHKPRQDVADVRPNDQMPVVRHQAVRHQPHLRPAVQRFNQNLLERDVVAVVVEDPHPPVPAVDHVVRVTTRRDSFRATHCPRLPVRPAKA